MNMSMMTPTMSMMGNDSMGDDHHHHHHPTTTQDPHAGHGGMGTGGEHEAHSTAEHTMQMYFHAGITEYILFEKLYTTNVGGLVGACVAVFVISVLYEGLKYFREFLLRRSSAALRQHTYVPSTTASNGGVSTKQPEIGTKMLSCSHFFQTLLHMVQVFVSYCLMLIFMTYNVYLCLAVILGAGLGYFMFGWRRSVVVDMNEHCH